MREGIKRVVHDFPGGGTQPRSRKPETNMGSCRIQLACLIKRHVDAPMDSVSGLANRDQRSPEASRDA